MERATAILSIAGDNKAAAEELPPVFDAAPTDEYLLALHNAVVCTRNKHLSFEAVTACNLKVSVARVHSSLTGAPLDADSKVQESMGKWVGVRAERFAKRERRLFLASRNFGVKRKASSSIVGAEHKRLLIPIDVECAQGSQDAASLDTASPDATTPDAAITKPATLPDPTPNATTPSATPPPPPPSVAPFRRREVPVAWTPSPTPTCSNRCKACCGRRVPLRELQSKGSCQLCQSLAADKVALAKENDSLKVHLGAAISACDDIRQASERMAAAAAHEATALRVAAEEERFHVCSLKLAAEAGRI